MLTHTLLATDRLSTTLSAVGHETAIKQAYTPYGYRRIGAAGTALGFTGQLPERVSGCYLLGNGKRAYNPVLMRFQSPDALSPFDKGGINSYAYCLGDPINMHDPSGNLPAWAVTAFANVPNVMGAIVAAIQAYRAGEATFGGVLTGATATVIGLWGMGAAVSQYNHPSDSFAADVSTIVGGGFGIMVGVGAATGLSLSEMTNRGVRNVVDVSRSVSQRASSRFSRRTETNSMPDSSPGANEDLMRVMTLRSIEAIAASRDSIQSGSSFQTAYSTSQESFYDAVEDLAEHVRITD